MLARYLAIDQDRQGNESNLSGSPTGSREVIMDALEADVEGRELANPFNGLDGNEDLPYKVETVEAILKRDAEAGVPGSAVPAHGDVRQFRQLKQEPGEPAHRKASRAKWALLKKTMKAKRELSGR